MGLLRISYANLTAYPDPFQFGEITQTERGLILALLSSYGDYGNGWLIEDNHGNVIPPEQYWFLDEMIVNLVSRLQE